MYKFLLINLGISIAINLVGFIVAFYLKTDKLTDFSYSLSFVVLAVTSLIYSGNINAPNVLLVALISVWALRLGSYLVIRIRRWGKDHRFDDTRSNFLKFLGFWIFQAITVWFVLVAPNMYFFQNQSSDFSVYHLIGTLMFLSALAFEATADLQLYRFTAKTENKGQFINRGLWKYSRHPNYFGEISVWVGAWLYTFPALTFSQKVIGFISPLFIYIMIRFVSGVPKLEKSAEKKWGDLMDYKAYKKRTGLLFPQPRI